MNTAAGKSSPASNNLPPQTGAPAPHTQSVRFLLLYALAFAGGAIAYVPFLTILLPLRVTELAGADDITWLAYIAFTGAIMASLANVLFGWLSDQAGNRRIWVLAGLAASSVILLMFPYAETIGALLAFIVIWQMALNMMLNPLAALAGDYIPDEQKGRLGGLLAFAPAAGAVAGAVVTYQGLAAPETRLWIVAAIVALCVLPVLLFGAPQKFPHLMVPSVAPSGDQVEDPRSGKIVARMWFSRLLIQICEVALFSYMLFWFRSVDSSLGEDRVAQIMSAVIVAAIPLAILVGRWTDKHNRPIGPLAICAAIAGTGLAAMALSSTPVTAIASYALFGIAASIFLSLHTSQTLRVLPKPQHRGRDLGIFNLTNTTPSLIMPWLVLMLVPSLGFQALLAVLSVLALLASLLLWKIDRDSK